MTDNLIDMFSDDEFVPHAYLDALFAQPNQANLTSLKQLKLLQQRTSTLLANWDIYTNGLTNELESQINALEQSNSIISYSYEQPSANIRNYNNDDDANSKLKPTTRLEYYVDSLSISINSLNDKISLISNKISKLEKVDKDADQSQELVSQSHNNSTTFELLKLTKSKQNLSKVLQRLETVESIVAIANDLNKPSSSSKASAPTNTKSQNTSTVSIKPNEFQYSIDTLKETIIEQFNSKLKSEKSSEIDDEFLTKINDLIELLPIFKNLGQFYSIYLNFSNFLKTEKSNYLNSKTSKDDDLFRKVLQ